jgi:hypothetical protein
MARTLNVGIGMNGAPLVVVPTTVVVPAVVVGLAVVVTKAVDSAIVVVASFEVDAGAVVNDAPEVIVVSASTLKVELVANGTKAADDADEVSKRH